MRQKGYDRDWKQCRNKIKNLKKEYRQVKDNNTQTGRGRKTCKNYKELDNILGHRPASVPAVLLDTGTTTNSSSAVLEDPLSDGAEEREELVTNGKNKRYYTTYRVSLTCTVIHCLFLNRWR